MAWVDMVEIFAITPSNTPTITQSNTPSPFQTPTITMTMMNTSTPIDTPLITSLEEGVDNFTLTFTQGGEGIWYGQNEKYFVGGDSSKPSELSFGETAYFETTVTGPGVMSFYLKRADYSDFDLKIDGNNQYNFGNRGPWKNQSSTVTITSTNTITMIGTDTPVLTITPTSTITMTATISATPTETISINEGVDDYVILFSDGGHKPWSAVYDSNAVDGDCAKSGDITSGEISKLIVHGSRT
jgi:hypothetical protein